MFFLLCVTQPVFFNFFIEILAGAKHWIPLKIHAFIEVESIKKLVFMWYYLSLQSQAIISSSKANVKIRIIQNWLILWKIFAYNVSLFSSSILATPRLECLLLTWVMPSWAVESWACPMPWPTQGSYCLCKYMDMSTFGLKPIYTWCSFNNNWEFDLCEQK